MFEQLNKLNCFTTITSVEKVSLGLSSQCYKVVADGRSFFVKKITSPNEADISILASKQSISPEVFYHDQHWLINPFIEGKNLALSQQPIEQKIAVAIKLMLRCHQIDQQPSPLVPIDIINVQICQSYLSAAQQKELSQLAIQLTTPLTQSAKTVCCHGDVNFSNVMVSANNEAFLIDFECAYAAPVEYDLAMFIAVNDLNNDDMAIATQCYQHEYSSSINHQLLNDYQNFCYFINGLWYFNRYQIDRQLTYKRLAEQQFNKLNMLQNNCFQRLFSCLGIKL